jgi:hypothetical protein
MSLRRVPSLSPAEIKPIHFLPSSANPAMASVSRWAQVFFTQSLPRPDAHHFKDHAPRADTLPVERIEFIASPSLAINNGFCKTGRSLYASGRPAAP